MFYKLTSLTNLCYRVIILHLLRSEFNQNRGTQAKNLHRIRVDRFLEVRSFCCDKFFAPAPFVPKKTR